MANAKCKLPNEMTNDARTRLLSHYRAMSLLRWLGITDASGDADTRLAGIERELEAHGPERARFLACFAYILTRAARADHQITDAEAHAMEGIVSGRAKVSMEQAALIVRIARDAGHTRGTDDFLITREFARMASRDEKLGLLDALFAITAADASIVTVEDNEVRRIASELNLEHADYIGVRQRHLGHLKVLRRDE